MHRPIMRKYLLALVAATLTIIASGLLSVVMGPNIQCIGSAAGLLISTLILISELIKRLIARLRENIVGRTNMR